MWNFSGGLPETKCGAGSRLANTIKIRNWLPKLIAQFEISTMVDAPCGDLNWISRTDLSKLYSYTGIDVDVELAEKCKFVPRSFRPVNFEILHLDILADPLPVCELLLCRDYLQHLKNEDIELVIKKFSDSADWLLATCHDNMINADISEAGHFRPLNLMAEPFNFTFPVEAIDDGAGRLLGLWKLN